MHRKKFLSSIVPLAATFTNIPKVPELHDPEAKPIIPAYLKKGDTIGITCPAGLYYPRRNSTGCK